MNVIELFTSQGCSSCPSADALLKEYVDRPDVIALSFNVDYWDYLGWKDTLSKPAYSKRQRAYAKARGDGKVYTPQIVANGVTHAVGSDRPAVELAINKSADRISGSNVDLILETDESNFVIKIGAAANKPKQPATIYMAAVSPSVSVKINRGENTGREVTYHNVVRSMIPVGMWSGEETTIRLRRQDVMSNGGDRCAVLVQFAPAGPIVAANWMPE
ncbi:MAG: DUF1223 domain-containing protein [Alphaproteobacteria bacterium]|nr:DUF1223 domain-containing protein [Alphaproteobacteria bacterium]